MCALNKYIIKLFPKKCHLDYSIIFAAHFTSLVFRIFSELYFLVQFGLFFPLVRFIWASLYIVITLGWGPKQPHQDHLDVVVLYQSKMNSVVETLWWKHDLDLVQLLGLLDLAPVAKQALQSGMWMKESAVANNSQRMN